MTDREIQNSNEEEKQDDSEFTVPDLSQSAADAIAEIVGDLDIHIEDDQAVVIANELLEKFTSPLMIDRAAGVSSQVTYTMSPAGGVESARSVKGRNILFNLREAAFASISNLPALAILFEKYGKPDNNPQMAVAAVIALFGMLKTISSSLGIPLTQRTAGVLHTLWSSKSEDGAVPQDGLLEKVNTQFEQYRWQKINAEELFRHLETLERLRSIERENPYNSISIENIQWRLKETVKLRY